MEPIHRWMMRSPNVQRPVARRGLAESCLTLALPFALLFACAAAGIATRAVSARLETHVGAHGSVQVIAEAPALAASPGPREYIQHVQQRPEHQRQDRQRQGDKNEAFHARVPSTVSSGVGGDPFGHIGLSAPRQSGGT